MEDEEQGFAIPFALENFDKQSMRRGRWNGALQVDMGDVLSAVGDGYYPEGYTLAVDFRSEEDAVVITGEVRHDEAPFVVVTYTETPGEKRELSVPSGHGLLMAEDGAGLAEWAGDMKPYTLVDNLMKAGVPESWIGWMAR